MFPVKLGDITRDNLAWIGLHGLHVTTENGVASGRNGGRRKLHRLNCAEENE